jgi:hypothetical protein
MARTRKIKAAEVENLPNVAMRCPGGTFGRSTRDSTYGPALVVAESLKTDQLRGS